MSGASADGVVRSTPQRSYEIVGPIAPARFYPKFGPLPGVVAVEDQSGSWDTVGRTRRLLLSDGGHVIETITDTEPPGLFAYNLSDFQGVFGALVSGARAEWRFDAVDGGTNIRWSYAFTGKPGRGWIVAVIVSLFWAPYMRRVLPPIIAEVERRSDGPPAD